ncbi:MAG: glycosyltransferase family 39 protein [Bryobacterales bacterium]
MASPSTAARKPRREQKKRADHPAPAPPRPRPWLELFRPSSPATGAALLGILAVALTLRAHNLLGMFPILVDESIYLRWAEIIQHQGQWLISLLDGKPPLHTWLLALPRMAFDGDPLWTGRAVSVAIGLLSTLGIYAIGKRLAGEGAGLLAAGLYAVFPLAVLYDRLAYTESLVNLCGVAIVLTSIETFGREGGSWKQALPAAAAFGLGLFTKQTVLLFAFFPALAGFWLARQRPRFLITSLSSIYGAGLFFLALTWLLKPEAPTLGTHSAVLHHTGFYVQPAEFLQNPFVALSKNLPLLAGYVVSYVTPSLAFFGMVSLAYLTARRRWAAWLIVSVSVLPLLVEVMILSLMFPSRWAFPHFWPWLVVIGMAATDLWTIRRQQIASPKHRTAVAAAVVALIVAPVFLRSLAMLASPRARLHADDATGFLGSSAHVGFGIREAVDYLEAEAETHGPFVLLVDPIWGPPADAMITFLNGRHGIRAYEAWWTQLSGTHAILPRGSAALLRSHYERLEAGKIDFLAVPRVFYVTDTNYYTDAAVKIRQPDAKLVQSFPKPDGKQAIHVYRLK